MIAAAQEISTRDRYTVDGSDALEARLRELCDRVLREVRKVVPARKLEGLLLAGGYGRGEGGVLHTPDGDLPYNDLDFYIFLRGQYFLNKVYDSGFHRLGETISANAGIEIELKPDSLARWRALPVTMFSYDVVMGHKWLLGDDSLFRGCDHHREPAAIPPAEAARLLLNRCSGLLFAAEHLQRQDFGSESADFVARNIAKAQLGLGDAVLTIHGQYHWSCRERHKRLKRLTSDAPRLSELRKHHSAGVDFKLHPTRSRDPRSELQRVHDDVSALGQEVWLWAESKRLLRRFASLVDYSKDPSNKCPETAAWRNCLINARTFRQCSARYPRERLFRALPLLLWQRENFDQRMLKPQLTAGQTDFSTNVSAYHALWQRFN